MDPPNLPEKPTFPTRMLIALGGLAAGVVIGIGSTAVLEMRDQSFRTEQEVTSTLKVPVLASIPLRDETSVEHIKRMRKKVPAGA
jgi:capsular polysaccharide biosynthesis protein